MLDQTNCPSEQGTSRVHSSNSIFGASRLPIIACVLVLIGHLSIAVTPLPDRSGTFIHALQMGVLFGGIFGQAIVAASWASLGPGALSLRLSASLIWCVSIVLAISVKPWTSLSYKGNFGGPHFWFVAGSVAAVWLILQILLWGLRVLGGPFIRIPSEHSDRVKDQYRVAHLLVFMTIVAAILGCLRFAAPSLAWYEGFPYLDFAVVYSLLTFAAVMIGLSLVPATLLPRYGTLATIVMLMIVTLATWWEHDAFLLLPKFAPATGSPSLLDIAGLNSGIVAWTLIYSTLLRSFGYRLLLQSQ